MTAFQFMLDNAGMFRLGNVPLERRCPNCNGRAPLDSLRAHRDGTMRAYYECPPCDSSIVDRRARQATIEERDLE